MSHCGTPADNAVAESFFSSLKRERTNGTRYETREAARRVVFEYIEMFYNRRRRHSTLGQISPAEFERRIKAR
jgi:putative transposase